MQEKLKKRANKAVDPIALETWINDTLNEAEYFKVDGTVKRLNNARGQTGSFSSGMMFDYGIDRLTLNKSGVSNENVDRLYRQLFVTTTGFLQTVEDIVKDQANVVKLAQGVHSQFRE